MPKKDLTLSVAAAIVAAVFLTPTLLNNGFFEDVTYGWILVFLVFPVFCTIGMFVAYIIGKKLKIIWQLAKFGFVGVLNTAIDFGILNALISFTGITSGFGIVIQNAISFSCAVINSFFWNRQWVFENKKKANFSIFFIISVVGLLINSGIIYFLTTYVEQPFGITEELWVNIAKAIATPISMAWNFLGYKIIVFKK